MVNAEEGSRGAREKDASLVNCVIGWIEGAVFFEGALVEREEEGRRDTLIDCVFGNVYEKKRKHTKHVASVRPSLSTSPTIKVDVLGEEESTGTPQVGPEFLQRIWCVVDRTETSCRMY